MTTLFENGALGDITVKNRVFMAPLTRNRAHPDGTPHEMAIKYYTQRASAGLIVAEATQISPEGKGYINTPGIYNEKHVDAWRKVTDSVHATGGKIVLQLWHVGRISHTSHQPNGGQPLAPSDVRANADTFTESGVEMASTPRALLTDEIGQIVDQYAHAAKLAISAGFDGVEIHAANGYLLNQFISTNTNLRDDRYGGNVENRARFLLEVVDAVIAEIGLDKTGVRLSPAGTFNDIHDEQVAENYTYIYAELGKRRIAFLHVAEKFPGIAVSDPDLDLLAQLRNEFNGTYIANGDYGRDSATEVLETGAFAVAFGRPFIANPDLPERLEIGLPLADVNEDRLYGGDETGYSDYPRFEVNVRRVGGATQ